MSNLTTIIPFTLTGIVLLIGSLTDLKTREVPDWINIGFIGLGFLVHGLFSVVFWDYQFIVNSLAGFGIFFSLAWLMFYTGQWGGGDSKMLMGMGSMIGINVFEFSIPFMAEFFVNMLFVGAVYGLLWSFYLALKHRKAYAKNLAKMLRKENVSLLRKVVIIGTLALLAVGVYLYQAQGVLLFVYVAVLVYATFWIWILIKAVEKTSMLKWVTPLQLTEGDWIAKNVRFKGKVLTGPKDLGIDKSKIKKLIELYKKKKITKVMIKEGIPFVPSFLIAFVVTLLYGSVIGWFF